MTGFSTLGRIKPRGPKRLPWAGQGCQPWITFLLWMVCLATTGAKQAGASVAVLLEQPYGGMGAFNPTGHSALYFDHICADTPVRLRPCLPGEPGVVISRYNGVERLDWVAIPLVPYLYAVESPAEMPLFMDRLTELRMRDLYRREHLESVAPDLAEGGLPPGNWYELVGSAFDRTIYGFQVNTTAAQDEEIIALFNDRPNVTRYNGAFRNCADFVRTTMDLLYPHAIRRNLVADFGLTTPKAVARSLTRYAREHPETGFQVFQIPQVPGNLPRSVGVEGVTESLLKRYGLPMIVVSPYAAAVVLTAYIGRGRFDVPRDAPALDIEARIRSTYSQPGSGTEAAVGTSAATDFGKVFEGYKPVWKPADPVFSDQGAASTLLPADRGEEPAAANVFCQACDQL